METRFSTVTFLFTDIEGSTRIWEDEPEAMAIALKRHDEIVRSCVEESGGHVFKTVGDAFCASFQGVREAIAAAADAQLRLADEPWHGGTNIRVRMALHTGEVESRDDDFFGPPLNRVARLLSIGHGGQTLVSAATQELARDVLPDGWSFKPMGEHRLKDLGRPETVYQLCHPSLSTEFPPLRSLEGTPNNLPIQPTSFIGREKELQEVRALFDKSRLVTLTGTGGCGKSRLGLQVVAEMLDGIPEGVWLVELAPVLDEDIVASTVAAAFGFREVPSRSIAETVVEQLKSKNLLILLDNCEHVRDACGIFCDAVLRSCPKVRILATSRESLGIAGEQAYRVGPLDLPDPKSIVGAEMLSSFDATRLFIERAQSYEAGFAPTSENARALASICMRLDGIPLAIELAAARVRSLSVEDIDSRLDTRFRLLTGGSRTALPRQQTLRSLIDWSYDLLGEREKAIFCRLSVFAGGCTAEGAETGCAGDGIEDIDVLDILTSLVDKSLVNKAQANGLVRYQMLETVRQYARERLVESGEEAKWCERHLTIFADLGARAEPHLTGAAQQDWLNKLEVEQDNIRSALQWSITGNPSLGLRLAGATWRFWYVRGRFAEGRGTLEALLAATKTESRDRQRVIATIGVASLLYQQLDYAAAKEYAEEGLRTQGEFGDDETTSAFLNILGNIANEAGDFAQARELLSESLRLRRKAVDRRGIAISLNNLGNAARYMGEFDSANAQYEESVQIGREMQDQWMIASTLGNQAKAVFELEDYPRAKQLAQESLDIRRSLGDRIGISIALETLAAVKSAQEDPILGARIWGAAERLLEEIGAGIPASEREGYRRRVASGRSRTNNDSAFDAAWQEGRALPLEQAIAEARD